MMEEQNYFEYLNIDINTPEAEIKRKLVNRIRDVQGLVNSREQTVREQAEAELKELLAARNILLNPESRNNLIQEIKQRVLAESRQQKIKARDQETNAGKTTKNSCAVALLIDTSGSMYGDKIANAKRAMNSFVQKTDLLVNQVGLVQFGSHVTVVCELGDDDARLRDGINSLNADGGTPMLRGITVAYEKLLKKCRHQLVMVIATDGQPNEPKSNILSFAASLKQREVSIITIGIGSDVDSEFLKRLASSPEDYHFAEASFELERIYSTIATGLAARD